MMILIIKGLVDQKDNLPRTKKQKDNHASKQNKKHGQTEVVQYHHRLRIKIQTSDMVRCSKVRGGRQKRQSRDKDR